MPVSLVNGISFISPEEVSTNTPKTGLSSGEVLKRVGEYEYNEIPEEKKSPILGFVKKFWGITPWMLEITIGLERLRSRSPCLFGPRG